METILPSGGIPRSSRGSVAVDAGNLAITYSPSIGRSSTEGAGIEVPDSARAEGSDSWNPRSSRSSIIHHNRRLSSRPALFRSQCRRARREAAPADNGCGRKVNLAPADRQETAHVRSTELASVSPACAGSQFPCRERLENVTKARRRVGNEASRRGGSASAVGSHRITRFASHRILRVADGSDGG